MKIKACLKYIGVLLAKIIAWPYSFLVYPYAYFWRKDIRKTYYAWRSPFNPWFWLWVVLDDENDYGEHWWLIKHEYVGKETLWVSFRWAWARNNSWNLNQVLKIPFKSEVILSGYDTSKRNRPLEHCRFKWELYRPNLDDWIDGWDINQGDRLSQKYTNMGKAFCWYEEEFSVAYNPLFRGSYAGIWKGWMINYKYGFNQRGEALLDLKIKRFKKYYTQHWI